MAEIVDIAKTAVNTDAVFDTIRLQLESQEAQFRAAADRIHDVLTSLVPSNGGTTARRMAAAGPRTAPKSTMSAAKRKAVSARMRAYWKQRRASEAKS